MKRLDMMANKIPNHLKRFLVGVLVYCLAQFLIGKFLHHTGLGLFLAFLSTMFLVGVLVHSITLRQNKKL